MLIFVLQMIIPVIKVLFESQASNNIQPIRAENLLDNSQNNHSDFYKTVSKIKPGLFKAASGLSNKPMADKTIERIRSQLKLQCIMQISGEAAAYINIKNKGLKKCTAGEKVYDLFTVISISDKTVEISIVDHRVILSL